MTKKIKHPFEATELSTRQVNRYVKPLVLRFQEELRGKMDEAKKTKEAGKVPFRYDLRNDMLHLFVASSEGVISSPGYKGVYVDFDPVTHRIVGMTFLGFQSNILPQLEGVDNVKQAWRRSGWKLQLLSWLESFAGLFSITLEELQKKQSKDAVESWVDWYEENPTKLELMPVGTL